MERILTQGAVNGLKDARPALLLVSSSEVLSVCSLLSATASSLRATQRRMCGFRDSEL